MIRKVSSIALKLFGEIRHLKLVRICSMESLENLVGWTGAGCFYGGFNCGYLVFAFRVRAP